MELVANLKLLVVVVCVVAVVVRMHLSARAKWELVFKAGRTISRPPTCRRRRCQHLPSSEPS